MKKKPTPLPGTLNEVARDLDVRSMLYTLKRKGNGRYELVIPLEDDDGKEDCVVLRFGRNGGLRCVLAGPLEAAL